MRTMSFVFWLTFFLEAEFYLIQPSSLNIRKFLLVQVRMRQAFERERD